MAFVVKSDIVTVIVINTRSGDNRTTKISADIFDNIFRVGKRGFSVNIKAVGTIFVNVRLHLFERLAYMAFHAVKQSGTEGITQQSIVKMFDGTPNSEVAAAALGKQDMNMRIPFEVSAESVENTDKAGCEGL